MPKNNLVAPDVELINLYNSQFLNDSRYNLADDVLSLIFQHYPENNDINHILTKVVLLNGLYFTNVFATIEMAQHIKKMNIDSQLREGSAEVVEKIAILSIRGKTRRHYSFATKYCSWHFPQKYPIFDNLVERLLWNFKKQFGFDQFDRPDLREYEKYRNILLSFRSYFSLDNCSYKEVDRFLWIYAKDLYE